MRAPRHLAAPCLEVYVRHVSVVSNQQLGLLVILSSQPLGDVHDVATCTGTATARAPSERTRGEAIGKTLERAGSGTATARAPSERTRGEARDSGI
eukprot:304059-Prymnesium_polylepis.1